MAAGIARRGGETPEYSLLGGKGGGEIAGVDPVGGNARRGFRKRATVATGDAHPSGLIHGSFYGPPSNSTHAQAGGDAAALSVPPGVDERSRAHEQFTEIS